MPLWGQNKQKVKVRSIFFDDATLSNNNLVGPKTNEQIRATRQKIRTANVSIAKKIDETVLEFRKNNETIDENYQTNLNPLIVYEKKELEVNELVIETLKQPVPNVKIAYDEFKKNNLTSRYQSKKKRSFLIGLFLLLAVIGGLLGGSFWNIQKISFSCQSLLIRAKSFRIDSDDNADCSPKNPTWQNLLTYGIEYSKQVEELEARVKLIEAENAKENESVKSKIFSLNTLLSKKNDPVNDSFAENKINLETLSKEKNNKLLEYSILLKKAIYLDEALDSKKSERELLSMKDLSESEKIQGIKGLKMRIDELSKKTDETKLKELLKYKIIDGNEWKEIYEKAKNSYDNIKSEIVNIDFFGNEKANAVAVAIAEKRGFTKRMMVSDESKLLPIETQRLQKPMADSLNNMFKEMKAQKLKIKLLSGFRGADEQAQIFNEEFKAESNRQIGREFTTQEIIENKADSVINNTLTSIALPGYSRHHFGYTVDLTQEDVDYQKFDMTASYEWMSKNNFYNTKKFGIIPSYPKGVSEQGPEPESWEFVYIGNELLTNQ